MYPLISSSKSIGPEQQDVCKEMNKKLKGGNVNKSNHSSASELVTIPVRANRYKKARTVIKKKARAIPN
jgi:hypothetical protein